MLVFDKTRKRCVAPPTEDCDVPPTTTPPEEVEEEDRPNKIPDNRRRDQFSASNRQNIPFQLPDSPISSRQPILEQLRLTMLTVNKQYNLLLVPTPCMYVNDDDIC